MCILFLYTNPDAETGQFKLIIAANRDEQFKRPAKQANFWEEFPDILGGRDMEPGREGGTWFAMSKKGRISTLLNVMGGTSTSVKGRGWIVPEYLNAEVSAEQHLSTLKDNAHEYSLFNLLAVDVRQDDIDVHQVSNVGDTRKMCTSGQGFLGIGNHWLGRPTRKVSVGLARFKDIVKELGHTEEKEKLLEQLLTLLKWDKK